MEQAQKKTAAGSRTRSIAFVALTVAITAVSAWVTVPLGPVPFTLQIFAVAFMVLVLQPKEAVAAITAYLVLGAVGVPVFSGMRGGIGVLAGATGGFLWGYLLGVGLAVAVRFGLKAVLARDDQAKGARAFAIDFLTGLPVLLTSAATREKSASTSERSMVSAATRTSLYSDQHYDQIIRRNPA